MFFRNKKITVKILRTDSHLFGRRVQLTTVQYEGEPYYIKGIRGRIGEHIKVKPRELLPFI